jgi:hypothetical protein
VVRAAPLFACLLIGSVGADRSGNSMGAASASMRRMTAPNQPPSQMALGRQQPGVASVLDQRFALPDQLLPEN